ncbi:MAG: hypothetical protein ACI8QD_001451 [Cyclobacteriaceae bacterium]|jgi:hypothetical protein
MKILLTFFVTAFIGAVSVFATNTGQLIKKKSPQQIKKRAELDESDNLFI